MEIPSQFVSDKAIMKYTLANLKKVLNSIIMQHAEPPYCILLNLDSLDGDFTNLAPGNNALIINLPYYVDCPSEFHKRDALITMLEFRFPFLNFCWVEDQYIVADLKFPSDMVLPRLND